MAEKKGESSRRGFAHFIEENAEEREQGKNGKEEGPAPEGNACGIEEIEKIVQTLIHDKDLKGFPDRKIENAVHHEIEQVEDEGDECGCDKEGKANFAQIFADEDTETNEKGGFQNALANGIEKKKEVRAAEIFFAENIFGCDEDEEEKDPTKIEIVDGGLFWIHSFTISTLYNF